MRLVVLAIGYGAAVLVLTWPLGLHVATHLPHTTVGCDFDSLVSTWVLAHISRWLAAPWTVDLLNANIYYPTPDALFYGPTCLGALPVFAPVFLLGGNPTVAINAVFLGGVAATAVSLHWVLWHWTRSDLAALVAATAFLTTRWVLWDWIPGAPWFAMLWGFPLLIMLAAGPLDTTREYLVLAALAAVQCLTDPVYVAPAVLVPLAGIALVRLVRASTRPAGLRLLACVAAAGAILVVAHVGQFAVARRENLTKQTMWWFPVQAAELPGDLIAPLSPMALPLIGWVLAALAAVRALRRGGLGDALATRVHRHAAWWAVAGLLLSITPVIVVFGHSVPVLPLQWLDAVVHLHARLRNPIRLRVAGLFGLAMLSGLGFDWCARRVSRSTPAWIPRSAVRVGLALLVVATMYGEYRTGAPLLHSSLPAAYPMAPAPTTSRVLLPLLQKSGGPLLELPLDEVRVFPPPHARAMYRSIAHGRRLLNGYTSYYPPGFWDRMTLAGDLPDADALVKLVRDTGLAVILVHGDELDAAARARWLRIASGREPSRLRLWARDNDDLLFRVGSS
jgi:hypothetical protein